MSIAKFLNKDKVREVYENNLINMSDFEFKGFVYSEYNKWYIGDFDEFEKRWYIQMLNEECLSRFNMSCMDLLLYMGDIFYSADIALDVANGHISESELADVVFKQKKEDLADYGFF